MKAFAYLIPLSMLLVAGCGSDEAETAVVTSTETCHLDFINGSQERLVEITSGQLDVRGWAFDRNTMTTPENIEVIFKGVDGKAFSFTGSKRGERLDVAKAYSKETIKNAGFLLKTNVPALPQGIYSISLKMSQGKKTVLCGIKKNVKFI